ncbi:MAG: exodeoxyribonuclease VII small subunit [Bdellovibrio sp.]|nr:MAG: exodeoxyribonuclease VII small subunit [Bdellovibrio sp.]
MDFEKRLKRLEEIVEQMEKGDLPLEESLKLFEEGVKLSRQCHQELEKAEEKVKLLLKVEEDGSLQTEDFSPQES